MITGVTQFDLPTAHWDGVPGAGDRLPQAKTPSQFVLGPENLLAVPAVEQLLSCDDLDAASSCFNPLVVLGPTGIGKTHLARGLVRHWQTRLEPGLIEYFTAIDFVRQLRSAREENQIASFRQRLAEVRLLVIENLHRLPTRPFVQRELRDTLDVATDLGTVVVITSQLPPANIAGLDAGLRDRLSEGLTVRLQPPGVEARRRLLELSAQCRGVQLSDQQRDALADRVDGSPSQLFRAVAEHSLTDTTTDQLAGSRSPITCKQIVAVVARYFSLTQAAICSAARRKSLVYARGITIYLARSLTDLSYTQIGQILGRRDHSTIMHACRSIEQRLANDAATQQDIEHLRRILTAT